MDEAESARFAYLVGKTSEGLAPAELSEMVRLLLSKFWTEGELDERIQGGVERALRQSLGDLQVRLARVEARVGLSASGPRTALGHLLAWCDRNKGFIMAVLVLLWLAARGGVHLGDEVRRLVRPAPIEERSMAE